MRHGNLIGHKFHKLTILDLPFGKRNNRKVMCRCDCGRTKLIAVRNLYSGHSKSCGCGKGGPNSSIPRRIGPSGKIYWGCELHPQYSLWTSLKRRCLSASDRNYRYYGGRGIKLCDRWMSFALFVADMGPRPVGHSLDRINNDGNYEPGNCRWADNKTQARNRRSNRQITYDGKTMPLAAWADATGVNADALHMRLKKGWSVERALTTPVRKKKAPGDSFGEVTESRRCA